MLTMKMTSSAPTFAVSSHRLLQQPNGTNPAPVGWQVTARNDDTTTMAFKVAVICAKPVAKAFLPIVVKDYP